jgi:ubiquinone/menaquinone biosynthesis C-methylase UbiE
VTSFAELSPQEQARHLRDPAGAAGLATADALAGINRDGNLLLVDSLGIAAGDTVLEVGCGLGAMAAAVIEAAAGVSYVGLDTSETMIEAACERHRDLIGAGRTSFVLASSEHIPFANGHFIKVFSAGVIHFWTDPASSLAELKRVVRAGGIMSMGCLAPGSALPFARSEFGFHLRPPEEWARLTLEAGFAAAEAIVLGQPGGPQMIHLRAYS